MDRILATGTRAPCPHLRGSKILKWPIACGFSTPDRRVPSKDPFAERLGTPMARSGQSRCLCRGRRSLGSMARTPAQRKTNPRRLGLSPSATLPGSIGTRIGRPKRTGRTSDPQGMSRDQRRIGSFSEYSTQAESSNRASRSPRLAATTASRCPDSSPCR